MHAGPLHSDEMLHEDLEYSHKIQGLDCIYSGAVPLFTKSRVLATFDSESPTTDSNNITITLVNWHLLQPTHNLDATTNQTALLHSITHV